MNLKNKYEYLYYSLYNFWETVSYPKFWSDAKAVLSIIILELFIIQSGIIYYLSFIDNASHFGQNFGEIGVMLVLVCAPNYYYFLYKEKTKSIIQSFDQLDCKKKRVYGWVTWIIIVAIIVQFFLLLFLT